MGEIQEARIFAGYSGWGAGQLDMELAVGSWFPVDGTTDDVFRSRSDKPVAKGAPSPAPAHRAVRRLSDGSQEQLTEPAKLLGLSSPRESSTYTYRASARKRPASKLSASTGARETMSLSGLDEVGRGSWAGPLTVGAAVIPQNRRVYRIRDSKMLTESQREALFDRIADWCAAWAIGHASPAECDQLGMSAAQRLAARRAPRWSRRGTRPNPARWEVGFRWILERSDHRARRRHVVDDRSSIHPRKVTRDRLMRTAAQQPTRPTTSTETRATRALATARRLQHRDQPPSIERVGPSWTISSGRGFGARPSVASANSSRRRSREHLEPSAFRR